jgi:hypothetical protein
MKTHGTYQLTELQGKRFWTLLLDPAIRMRARRVFGKVQLTRTREVIIADTDEVCRDLVWFMERFPLEAADDRSAERLQTGNDRRIHVEQLVDDIIGKNHTRLALPFEPAKTPREYQLLAVDLLRARRRLLLTDEVGLGKTFTGLLGVLHPDARPALIVPPTHLPPRWQTETEEAFPDFHFAIAKTGTPTSELKHGMPDVLVVPYSKLVGWAAHVAGEVKTVVFDEVQELRNGIATDKGKAAALVVAESEYSLGLTATPVYNYGGEIWNIYDILAPGELGTREEFQREWGGGSGPGGQMTVADPHALGSYLRESGLMLGRTRAEVGRELPKTIKVPTEVDSHHAALDAVKATSRALAEQILGSNSTAQEKFQAAGQIDMELRQATGVDKAPFVAEFVKLLLEAEDRVVIWGWHRRVYEIWAEQLKDYNPQFFTGAETPRAKADAIRNFTDPCRVGDELIPGAARILIMSLRSGAGVDGLQKVCRVGVFGELDWSPQVHEQAIGRLRRDGMGDDPPVAYFLYSTDGSDPALMEVLQVKRQQSEPMISPDGKLLANATVDTRRGRRLAEQILGITPTVQQEEIAS